MTFSVENLDNDTQVCVLKSDTELRIKKVKTSYLMMLILGIAIAVGGAATAWSLNEHWPVSCMGVKLVEYVGYVCWSATLGTLGWEIQTWGAKSTAEILDQRLAKLFSMVGIFAFVLARELIPLG